MAPKNYRLCISCRKTVHRDRLWRIVRTFPEHRVQLDEGIGRSAYLCKQSTCITAARKKNKLGRALKAPVPSEIYQQLEERLSAETTQSHLGATDAQES
ncbi:MAG: YlxR family protein [Cyanobacteria bacterium J06554_11]